MRCKRGQKNEKHTRSLSENRKLATKPNKLRAEDTECIDSDINFRYREPLVVPQYIFMGHRCRNVAPSVATCAWAIIQNWSFVIVSINVQIFIIPSS